MIDSPWFFKAEYARHWMESNLEQTRTLKFVSRELHPLVQYNARAIFPITKGSTMLIEKTIKQLTTLLDDKENKVIALSGKWGTGKSFLWDQMRKDSSTQAIKDSLKISLFGISDLSQIKMRVLQSAIPSSKDRTKAKIFNATIAGIKSVKSALSGFHSSFNALDELAILAVPNLLKQRTIVLDDIERKHESLSIDEILGFIDEYTQQYETRFILILNSDKLANKELWEVLREKVIDQEVRLNTPPEEAYDIACITCKSPFEKQIKKAVETCNITNIRIIQKIIKNVNSLLSEHIQLPEIILSKLIPSTVLLSATYYKGIDQGPSFEQILSYGKSLDWENSFKEADINNPPTPANWEQIISNLGISSTDRYEDLVVIYLESGLLDSSEISKELDRYVLDNNILLTRHRSHALINEMLWDQHLSEEILLKKATDLIPFVEFMDAGLATVLSEHINDIKNGEPIARKLISNWISSKDQQQLRECEDYYDLGRPVHKDIQAAIFASKSTRDSQDSIYDAFINIITKKNWNPSDTLTLNNATPTQYKNILIELSPIDLKDFTREMIRIHKNAQNDDLEKAATSFIKACSNIVKTQQPERLSTILHRSFCAHKITHPD